MFRFQKFFVSLRFASFSFCLRFISFRFASDAKTSKKNIFSYLSEKISLPFRLEAKMMAVFCFRFASFHFEAKMMEVFRFCFASFHFEANDGSFSLLFLFTLLGSKNDSFTLCFRFVPFSLRFRFLFFASMRNKQKNTFFASERKTFRLRFASFRFEAKMTAHPSESTLNLVLSYEK